MDISLLLTFFDDDDGLGLISRTLLESSISKMKFYLQILFLIFTINIRNRKREKSNQFSGFILLMLTMKKQISAINVLWSTFDYAFDCIHVIVQQDLNKFHRKDLFSFLSNQLTNSSDRWTMIVDILFHYSHHCFCIHSLQRKIITFRSIEVSPHINTSIQFM